MRHWQVSDGRGCHLSEDEKHLIFMYVFKIVETAHFRDWTHLLWSLKVEWTSQSKIHIPNSTVQELRIPWHGSEGWDRMGWGDGSGGKQYTIRVWGPGLTWTHVIGNARWLCGSPLMIPVRRRQGWADWLTRQAESARSGTMWATDSVCMVESNQGEVSASALGMARTCVHLHPHTNK